MTNLLRRIRIMTAVFIAGLVLSGATAIPVQAQLDLLYRFHILEPDRSYVDGSWQHWMARIHHAVVDLNTHYSFLGYAGDWLAFGHFMIALVFVWAWREPVRYRFLFDYGLLLCACVIPYALVFGQFRGIPWWWRAVDCSFGLFGAIPLLLCRQWARRLADNG